MAFRLVFLLAFVSVFYLCCEQKHAASPFKIYVGPIVTADSLTTIYSDSGKMMVNMFALQQAEFLNGDREFAKGIKVDFYKKDGRHSARLTARYARYDRLNDIYVAHGDVVVENFIEKRKVNSEQMFWNRLQAQVYTDKFVKITTPKETLTGVGMKAAQDFSTYTVLKPTVSL